MDLILTVVAIKYLEASKNVRYNLIVKKAKEWVAAKQTECSIPQEGMDRIRELIAS